MSWRSRVPAVGTCAALDGSHGILLTAEPALALPKTTEDRE